MKGLCNGIKNKGFARSKRINPIIMHMISTAVTDVNTMAGGLRIFLELAKHWAEEDDVTVNIYTSREGYENCLRYGLENVHYNIWHFPFFKKLGLVGLLITYIMRTIIGSISAMSICLKNENNVIYPESDYWLNMFPAFMIKKKFPRSKWIGTLYLFAPNPLKGFRHYYQKGFHMPRLNELLYFLSQRPVYWLMKRYADIILVTSEPDKERIVKEGRRSLDDIFVVRGGVDIQTASKMQPQQVNKYDACFVGRFHPQKGVLELVDIWDYVCKEKGNAKLAMIGVGSLENAVKRKIKRKGLEKNISLLGYVDGEEKYAILKSSKIFLHPAVYDSGGMAAAEGMACGLPAVGFDLPALRTYYPRGMLKVPIGNIEGFAEAVLSLLKNNPLYEKTAEDALNWAQEWDWDKRASDVLDFIIRKIK